MGNFSKVLEHPLRIEKDADAYKKALRVGFVSVTVYSVAYGIYEYFVVYNYPALIHTTVLNEWMNWSMMIIGYLVTVLLVTRFRIEQTIMGLFYMAMLEDLVFWMCKWADEGEYPFPARSWGNDFFPSFEVLGLGNPIPFWPYVPVHYLFGFTSVILYYTLGMRKGPKHGRIVAWLTGPLFLAVGVGALANNDATARIILITVPSVLYSYALLVLYFNRRKR